MPVPDRLSGPQMAYDHEQIEPRMQRREISAPRGALLARARPSSLGGCLLGAASRQPLKIHHIVQRGLWQDRGLSEESRLAGQKLYWVYTNAVHLRAFASNFERSAPS